MKKINYFLPIFALLFSSHFLFGQEYKITVQNTKDGILNLNDFYGDLPIEGYSGNEIIVTSTSDRFENPPDRAKGLKPVYPEGTDNTGLALSEEKNGNEVTLRCLLPITQGGATYKIKVPENFAIRLRGDCSRSNSVFIQNMKNEIEVNICESIKLKNVSGPLVLSNISGNINVVFTELSLGKPISIASVNGEIDVTLPAKAPVNLEMRTVSGNMYSDFDFHTDSKDIQRVGGNSVRASLNGGGTDLRITNVSGNIYLRKG
jgi:lia operon protein LiaG